MTPKRLLHVFPGFGVGGAQIRFASLANSLGAAYRHSVVSLDGSLAARERLDPSLKVAFPAWPLARGTTASGIAAIRRFLLAQAPDVLVTHNWGSMDWAIANLAVRIRHIHIEDGFGPEERETQLRRRVITRRLVLRRSTVVLPSLTLARIAQEVWRLPPSRLRYIPNGIDLRAFDRATSSCADGRFAGEGPLILTVAALRPEKNLGRLLRAFARAAVLFPARLAVVGEGSEREPLQRLGAQLGVGDRVHFLGYVPAPAGIYAASDIFALSSDTEQMPISVLEAMAAGLPVAATNVGDVRAMLSAENGPFVTPLSDEAIGDALCILLRDPPLRMRVGVANRAKAERDYDIGQMLRAYADLFEGTASVRCGPASQSRAA